MTINVQGLDSDGTNRQTSIDRYPDTCPIRHVSLQPNFILASFQQSTTNCQIVFRCTTYNCGKLFIGTYSQVIPGLHSLVGTEPRRPVKRKFPPEISKISSAFVEIYSQAVAAEGYGLDQVVGISLRKSLEFLIKDYAIATDQSEGAEQRIKHTPLGTVINGYIEDKRVKALAQRAVWLGNDETHYVGKWEDKDIKDLKAVVTLTVNAVHNAVLGDSYIEGMPHPSA